MKVVVPYTVLRKEVLTAIVGDVDTVLMDADDAYHRLLLELWDNGETFAVIEHDVKIHPDVLTGFEECAEWWCAYPYQYRSVASIALGCARFRAELLAAEPDVVRLIERMPDYEGFAPTHWRVQDGWLTYLLHLAGHRPHRHHPPVRHLTEGRSR